MKFLKLGSSDRNIDISKIVIGTDKIANSLSDAEFFYLLDIFVESGGNCIDTARLYCGGKSEEVIGRWLKRTGLREKIVLSSKGCHPDLKTMSVSRLTKSDMEHDIDRSLRSLGTDVIDIYWLHRDDPSIPAGEIIENLNSFIKAGKIRFIGASNWKAARIEEANDFAAKSGYDGFVSSQIQWSLAETGEEIYRDYGIVIMNGKEYDWYLKHKIPVFAYAPQAQGFFPKAAKGGLISLSEKTRARFGSENNLKRLENLKAFSAQRGVSLSAASLAYLLCNKLPCAAVIGSRTPDQLRDSLSAADISISEEEADKLFEI